MIPNQTSNETSSATTDAAEASRTKPKAKRDVATKPETPGAGRQTKQQLLIGLLQRTEGASIAELVKATGWQNHSIRGAISFTLKKKLALNVTSQRDEKRGRIYRIAKPTKPTKASRGRTKKPS